jgi:uncharacterized protein YciI
MHRTILIALAIATLPSYGAAPAPPSSLPIKRPSDPVLAKQLGADERGMRSYVLVVLKSGPTPVPAGPARDEMFRGHFANINRLAAEGKLVVAGPFDGSNGWRGMFIFAVDKIEAARTLVALISDCAATPARAALYKAKGSDHVVAAFLCLASLP